MKKNSPFQLLTLIGVSVYGIPWNMINNTYKDWFCVDTSVQNDIYRLSGPIVGIWAAAQFSTFGENLDRLHPKNASKRIHISAMTCRMKERKIWFFFIEIISPPNSGSQCSWVISFRGQKFSFLRSAHFADNCPARPNGSSDNPASPFPKMDHLIL